MCIRDRIKTFPESLNDQPIILPTVHSKLREDIDYYFNNKKIFFEKIAEVQDTSVQKLLAVDGEGLIAVPEFSIKGSVFEKELFFIGSLENVFEEFWLISAKRTISNPVVSKLMKNFKFTF